MKEKILLFLVMLVPFLVYSQKTFKYKDRYFPITYVLKGKQDSVKTRIMNTGKFTNSKFSYYTILFKKMKVMDSLGNPTIIQRDQFKYMAITDLEGKKWEFENANTLIKDDLGLVQLMFSGKKTKIYETFSSNLYDMSIIPNYMIVFNKERYSISKNSLKKIFGESNGEMIQEIDEVKKLPDIIKFLEKYDK